MTVAARMPEKDFFISVEVVPPAGPDADPLLDALAALDNLPVDAFSVATNPVAKPRMSAMALCTLIQQRTGRAAILHCTTRDHNRLSLQGLLWGARALGLETVLITTGDFVALGDRTTTSDVRDLDLFALLGMATTAGRPMRIGTARPSSMRVCAARSTRSCSPSANTTRFGSRRAASKIGFISRPVR